MFPKGQISERFLGRWIVKSPEEFFEISLVLGEFLEGFLVNASD